jgi:hypothetical protein
MPARSDSACLEWQLSRAPAVGQHTGRRTEPRGASTLRGFGSRAQCWTLPPDDPLLSVSHIARLWGTGLEAVISLVNAELLYSLDRGELIREGISTCH